METTASTDQQPATEVPAEQPSSNAPVAISAEEQAANERKWRRAEYAQRIMAGLVVNAGNVSFASLADQAVSAAEALLDRLER